MAKMSRVAGSTSHILTLFIQDSSQTDGRGLAGLTNATSGLACYYKRNTGSASSAVTLDTITTLGTYGSYAAGHGGFKEVDSANMPGVYEFQPPDAAYASGAKSVAFLLKGAANMAPVPIEIELTGVDNQDATAFGLSRLDAAISSRSTYAGGDTSGTTTLLSRLTSTRAGLLDNLDAAISTRSTYAGADTSGTTTLLGRLTAGRATNLDNLDATVSSRLATSGYTAPPSAASIATTIFQDITSSSDFTTVGSFGKLIVTNLDAAVSTRSTYAGGDTAGTTTLLSRLSAGRATNLDNLDVAVSTRSTYAGGDTAGTTTLLARLTSVRAGLLDNLDAAISTRSTYAGADTGGTTTLLGLLTPTRAGYLDNLTNLDAAISTRSTFAGGAVASVTGDVGGNVVGSVASVTAGVTVATVNDKTGYSLNLAQAGLTVRALDAVADANLTVGDALVAAIAGAAGKESVAGTSYLVKTPATGTTIRTFTLDDAGAPTSRN